MKLRNLFILILFPVFCQSQNFYETIIFDSLEEDTDYIFVREKLDSLNYKINQLFEKAEYTIVEEVLLKDLLFFVETGYDSLAVVQLAKPEVQDILTRSKIDQKALVELARMKQPFIPKEESLRMIYNMKERLISDKYKDFNWPKNRERIKELSKYKLRYGERILEIGAGSLHFSKEISKKVKNCEIYINELDTVVLKNIYYQLDYLEEISEIKEKRNNQFFLIRGGEKTTGVENKKFDRIIIRKVIHHFSEPETMFNSIKKSMDEHTELIVKERFPENCEVNCCSDLLPQNKFETLMKKNDFVTTYRKKLTTQNDGKYWIYKFKLPAKR